MDVDRLVDEMYNEMLKRCNMTYRHEVLEDEDETESISMGDIDAYNPRPELGKGVKFERIRRITGYLVGDVNRWNNGKKSELKDRTKHEL